MSPTIRIDDDVYQKLKEQAEPFVDTPNSVIRRLLGLGSQLAASGEDPAEVDDDAALAPAVTSTLPQRITSGAKNKARQQAKKAAAKRTRVPAGMLLPESDYDLPMLHALIELGGSASSRAVTEAVGKRLKDRLTPLDKEQLKSGGVRWENRLQFVRLRLIDTGLMVKESGRGIWAISEAGRKFAAAESVVALGAGT
jgi:hypothetical protein